MFHFLSPVRPAAILAPFFKQAERIRLKRLRQGDRNEVDHQDR
jgi:hypothetical protein